MITENSLGFAPELQGCPWKYVPTGNKCSPTMGNRAERRQSMANPQPFPLLCWCPDRAGLMLVRTGSSASHFTEPHLDSYELVQERALKCCRLSQLPLQNHGASLLSRSRNAISPRALDLLQTQARGSMSAPHPIPQPCAPAAVA